MKMKAQTPIPLEYTKRHGRMTAQYAVRDIYDALVELITNSDDSYFRLGDSKGEILVEIERKSLGKSRVIVRDRAEGMTLDDMQRKIRKVGDLTSAKGDRSFLGRGAKDCATLGKVTFESIGDSKYHKCEVLTSMDFIPYSPSIRVTEDIRKHLSIPHRNGTVVTINVEHRVRIHRHDTLLSDLPRHHALRDIMSKETGRKVKLRDLNDNKQPDRLIYNPPSGNIVIDEEFEVPNYQGITAHLLIFKSDERLEDPLDRRFRRTGIAIKGERAIHEVTFFSSDIERDTYSDYYFGRLICPHIDVLCREYDKRLEDGITHPVNNPSLIIDPNRQVGLTREHPFTKALFQYPIKCLRTLIAKDKETERQRQVKIENEETRKSLDKLAKAASKFIQDKCDEMEDIGTTDELENKEFIKKGVLIIPDIYTLGIGEIKAFGFRAMKREGIPENTTVKVTTSSKCVRILTPEFLLSTSPTKESILTGYFKVEGIHPCDAASIWVNYDGLPTAEAFVSVAQSKFKAIEIPHGFAFERESYQIKEGKKKGLILRAAYPSVVDDDTLVEAFSDCEDIVILKPQARLIHVPNTNYSEAQIVIQGRKLGIKGNITAKVNNHIAKANIKVIVKEERGIPLEIGFTQEDIGAFRAKWDYPNNPNKLLIAVGHPALKRYLGPAPEYQGQKDPHFKLLIAEIVSENVVSRILEEEERIKPWEYEDLNVQRFYAHHNKLMREFLPIAHEISLTKQELQHVKMNNKQMKLL